MGVMEQTGKGKDYDHERRSSYRERVTVHLPTGAMKKLRKGKRAHVMEQNKWYELIPCEKTRVRVGTRTYLIANGKLAKMHELLKGEKRHGKR